MVEDEKTKVQWVHIVMVGTCISSNQNSSHFLNPDWVSSRLRSHCWHVCSLQDRRLGNAPGQQGAEDLSRAAIRGLMALSLEVSFK